MSDEQAPREEQQPAKSGGMRPLLLLLVVAAAVAAFYFYRTSQAPEAPGTAPGTEQAEAERRAPELPIFAPKASEREAQAGDDAARAEAEAETPAQPTVTRRAAAPQTDRILTPAFVTDLAAYLAAGFHPAGTTDNPGAKPMTTVTFKKLNMRYGVDLHGLDVAGMDPAMGRKQALDHLMSPIVLRLAYGLYGDKLVATLAAAGRAQTRHFAGGDKPLTTAQVGRMLKLYSALVGDVGRTFEIFASRRELVDLMGRYFAAVRTVNEAYADYADREAAGAEDKELDAISVGIKKAITAREALRRELLRGAMPREGSLLAEGDVLDIAAWVSRRLSADHEAINAVGALANLCRELSAALAAHDPAN